MQRDKRHVYCIDRKGKIKSGVVIRENKESCYVAGVGRVNKNSVFNSKVKAEEAALKIDWDAEYRRKRTSDTFMSLCPGCQFNGSDFCDFFCVIETDDGRYFHSLFVREMRLPK